MSSYKDFKVLLFQLAEKLEGHDLEGIRSIEDLPAEFEGQSALKILLKLEMQGKVSASNSIGLEEVFKNIGRIDLVKKVKDFFKSRKCKKNTSNTAEEQLLSLRANLEVTLMQMRLLQDQLLHLQKTAEASGTKSMEVIISEAMEDAEKLGKKLLYAKEQHAKGDQSPELSESDANLAANLASPVPFRDKNPFNTQFQHELAAQITMKKPITQQTQPKSPKAKKETDMHVPASPVPLLPPVTKTEAKNQIATTSDAELYAELTPRPSRKAMEDSLYYESATLVPSISGALESSALVTGALASPKNRKKPIPAPKPKAKLQERRQREAKKMDTEEDNTGTTGDSGFADARPFLKVSIEPSSSSAAPVPNEEDELTTAGYYKSIRREEVGVSYYKLANREAQTQMFQEIMNSGELQLKDEGIYENYPVP